MTDYISRDAAIKAAMQDTGFHRSHEFNAGCARAANNLKAIHAADVAPVVHGYWITCARQEHYPSGKEYEEDYCSVCGKRGSLEYDYCPNCGAKMIEEKE